MPTDPIKAKIEKTFKCDSPLIACRFDPTGKYLFAGAEDQRVWRWDLASDAKSEFAGHASWVRSIAFDKSGATVITGGFDGRLIWWPANEEKAAPRRTIEAHAGWIRAIAVNPDGALLASCGNDKLVKLWKVDDGSLIREFAGHEAHVYNVAFHPDGKNLVSGDLKANFRHWEVESGKQLRTFSVAALHKYDEGFKADIGGPHGLAFSADGKRLACAGITEVTNAFAGVGNPAVVVVDWEAGKESITHLSKGKIQGAAWGTVLHGDGFTIAAVGGGGGGHLFFWKPDQKDEFHTLNLGNIARDLAIHPNGTQLATAHFDRQVRLVSIAS